jgi:hypothetical protein
VINISSIIIYYSTLDKAEVKLFLSHNPDYGRQLGGKKDLVQGFGPVLAGRRRQEPGDELDIN